MQRSIPSPPRSPLTTRFSGTMRENKERIRNIFNGGRKRQGRWLLVPAVLLILFCSFFLISCQRQTVSPSLVMETQYYDKNDNCIEIPVLVLPEGEENTEGITAINQALSELRTFYQPVLAGTAENAGLAGRENQCLLYPTETERYLNLLFFRNTYHTDLNTGHITTLIYDKDEGVQVTLAQALEIAGQTEEGLLQALGEQYDPILSEEIPGVQACIQNQALEGFRMGQDGQPVFYLTARVDDADDTAEDALSGAEHIYIWSGGSFTQYDQYAVSDLQPLVPAEECLDLEPPLWRQWFFDSGVPENGFSYLTYPLTLSDGRTLTLEFEEAPSRGAYSAALVHQVNVWDGSRLLQTITGSDVWRGGMHFYEGLYHYTDMDEVPGAPDLRDINGDGSADLGLLANETFPQNVNYAYFLWDDQAEQLRYCGMFFAPLELEGPGQIIETEHGGGRLPIRRRYIFPSDRSDINYGVPLLTGFDSRGSLPQEETVLPIPEAGLTFSFSSGAGAWSTSLTLLPDGTFSGEYHDSDMDVVHLCQFRGVFSMFTPLDGHTYALTLTDLEITTGHPVEEEWTEGGKRYIASRPYGLDGGNEFLLYLPGTTADLIPGIFRSWNGDFYGLNHPDAVLSGYSLCNLRAGYGFFT